MLSWFSVVVVAVALAGTLLVLEMVARLRDRREGPHYVEQLEAWRAKGDPPIVPLDLPAVRPLTARKETRVRFPHAVARPQPSRAQPDGAANQCSVVQSR